MNQTNETSYVLQDPDVGLSSHRPFSDIDKPMLGTEIMIYHRPIVENSNIVHAQNVKHLRSRIYALLRPLRSKAGLVRLLECQTCLFQTSHQVYTW